MTNSRDNQPSGDPFEMSLSGADDRLRLSKWLPPRAGIVPHIRIGGRWINILWVVPLASVALILGIAVAQELRTVPAVQEFLARYPGVPASAPAVHTGFPLWLRLAHFFNLFFMIFIIRSGIQILADHPRLYWRRDSTPGTEWFRFQDEVPKDRMWTSKDDSVTIPKWLGIPGIRHSIGLARWWHFSFDLLWLINGGDFLCAAVHDRPVAEAGARPHGPCSPTHCRRRFSMCRCSFPSTHGWTHYNGLQQLTYFVTVFVAAPLAIITGLMQGPAIANRLGWFAKILNRQAARTIHFVVLCWFLLFILTHVTLVFITGVRQNLELHVRRRERQVLGRGADFCVAMVAGDRGLVSRVALHDQACPSGSEDRTNNGRPHQGLRRMVGSEDAVHRTGHLAAFLAQWHAAEVRGVQCLVKGGFANYRLRVSGLVENPRDFSYAELKAMPKQEQITDTFCIQGWSGVAKVGWRSDAHILDIVKPTPDARYAVFYSFAEGSAGGGYYDVHKIQNMRHELTLLAYEMNGAPVSVLHGAPLRLRCENELGFKMVKWIEAIEFVHDFAIWAPARVAITKITNSMATVCRFDGWVCWSTIYGKG